MDCCLIIPFLFVICIIDSRGHGLRGEREKWSSLGGKLSTVAGEGGDKQECDLRELHVTRTAKIMVALR